MKIYKVGGAVRDSLLEVEASDNDWVVVGSSPEEMITNGFKPIGKDFPVFLHPETNEEYALARTERKSGTGYHGFTFYFGKDVSLEDDLSRRDFTINAIAEDENGEIIDPFNGQEDLNKKIFRHVSDAFYEDPLRAIRLARFYTYDHLKEFVIDNETLNGIKRIISSGEIAELSPERVWSETSRALKSSNPNLYFEKIISLGLLDPFFSKLKVPDCDNHVDQEIRWSELQINNNFDLGQNLPVPNGCANASSVLKNISKMTQKSLEEDLLSVIKNSHFIRNEETITKLCTLPNLEKNRDYILKIVKEIKNTDFSFLSDTPNEKVEAEKIKIYKKIIHKCK